MVISSMYILFTSNIFFLIFSPTESWFVLTYTRLLLMESSQRTLSILRRQLFINTCTFLVMVKVVLHISNLYSRNFLTYVLKVLILILVESCFEFHIFINCRHAALALPILAFTFSSDRPSLSMIPIRYAKHFTSTVSESSAIGLVFLCCV
ncbi:unnamed protein product [Schistosoma margrebowiei]|uniref:Uncharacterized protein n=1 Tax=Schistosoma margrebowiei TaxID=48269 RepID=A0A3P8CHS0_9TREM|nr:unnamed protein product [Schistosoma margrebowiei]